jgi:hypothetical protein
VFPGAELPGTAVDEFAAVAISSGIAQIPTAKARTHKFSGSIEETK